MHFRIVFVVFQTDRDRYLYRLVGDVKGTGWSWNWFVSRLVAAGVVGVKGVKK